MTKKRRNKKPGEKIYIHYYSDFSSKPKRKEFDLYDPKVKQKMKVICSIIENSLKRGMSFEEVVERLLSNEREYSNFLNTYINEYNTRMKEASARVYAIASSSNFRVLSKEEIIKNIYDKYIEQKNTEIKTSEENSDPNDHEDLE